MVLLAHQEWCLSTKVVAILEYHQVWLKTKPKYHCVINIYIDYQCQCLINFRNHSFWKMHITILAFTNLLFSASSLHYSAWLRIFQEHTGHQQTVGPYHWLNANLILKHISYETWFAFGQHFKRKAYKSPAIHWWNTFQWKIDKELR